MLGKMQLMQKLEHKIRENNDLHVTLQPMIELVKAEKNKLMIQRLEIESELREMQGEDPNSSIDAAIASGDDDTEYYSTTNSIVNEQSSSSLESAKPTGFDEETNPSMAPSSSDEDMDYDSTTSCIFNEQSSSSIISANKSTGFDETNSVMTPSKLIEPLTLGPIIQMDGIGHCKVYLNLDARLNHRSQETCEEEEEEDESDASESEEEVNQDGVYIPVKDRNGKWKLLEDLMSGHKESSRESTPTFGELVIDED